MPTRWPKTARAWSARKRISFEAAGHASNRMARAHHEGRPADSGPDARGHQDPSVDEGPRGLRAEVEDHAIRCGECGRNEGRSQNASGPAHLVTRVTLVTLSRPSSSTRSSPIHERAVPAVPATGRQLESPFST